MLGCAGYADIGDSVRQSCAGICPVFHTNFQVYIAYLGVDCVFHAVFAYFTVFSLYFHPAVAR